MENLKLATWNIKNSYFALTQNPLKVGSVILFLLKDKPDILALQEVNPILATMINEELEQMNSPYQITSTYKKSINPIKNVRVEYDMIISKIKPTLSSATEPLPFIPQGFSLIKHFPSIRERGLTWQFFEKNIIINNTHLDATDYRLAKRQMQEVLTFLKIQQNSNCDIFLMGNINSKPNQFNMIEFTEQLSAIGMKVVENQCNTFQNHIDNQPVDYIIIPDRYEVESVETLRDYEDASSHYPVIAKVVRR